MPKRKFVEPSSTDSVLDIDEHLAALFDRNPRATRPKFNKKEFDATKSVIFQAIDVKGVLDTSDKNWTHELKGVPEKLPPNRSGGVPIVHAYGVNEKGQSVCAHVHGYRPYIYMKQPANYNPEIHNEPLKVVLDAMIKNERSGKACSNPVVKIESMLKKALYNFSEEDKSPHLKITLAIQEIVTCTRRIIEDNRVVRPFNQKIQDDVDVVFDQRTFESNIDFEVRFMVDTKLYGCSWMECKDVYLRKQDEKETTAQIEIDVGLKNVVGYFPEGEWSKNAKTRILSFDIECISGDGRFPDATKLTDKCIQISCVVQEFQNPDYLLKVVLCLHDTDPMSDCSVVWFRTEAELLLGFRDLIEITDPDYVTGYNIQNFDFPFLVDRAKTLVKAKISSEVANFGQFTRWKARTANYSIKKFQSKQMGNKENYEMVIDGRIMTDILPYVQREHKLRSYRLNAVASHFLKETKDDVKHTEIKGLWQSDSKSRSKLAHYCYMDAVLPLRLNDKLMVIVNMVEMARVTGVPMNYLILRGQSVKVLAQILRHSVLEDYVIPALKTGDSDGQFTGATVLEPKKNFYTTPIATLDFASLYPSIMRAHNLCYTTLVAKKDWTRIKSKFVENEDYVITPNNDMFMQDKVCKGLLPKILTSLILARKQAKRDIKKEECPLKKKILDGRQLALKISANSVYGFTGAQVGKLPCLEISSSVTGYGRQMIESTVKFVEEEYADRKTVVVYGDTDSVMVNFKVDTVKEAMDLGYEAAERANKALFKEPISLEFEKVYYPYLLMNKKRYAGMYYASNPDTPDKMDMKGIEAVRRDNCLVAGEILNGCLDRLLIQRDPQMAINFACYKINQINSNRVDYYKLVISKELSKTREEYKSKMAHVELAHRMSLRDPGSAPKLGERVPYVVISTGDKKTPLYERAEDPSYAINNSIPLDTEYYVKNQILGPLVRLFEPLFKESEVSKMLLADTYAHKKQKTGDKSDAKTAGKKNSMMSMLSKGRSTLKKVDIITKRPIPAGNIFFSNNVDDASIHLCDQSLIDMMKLGDKSQLYQERLNGIVEFSYYQNQFMRTKQQCNITCLKSFKADNMDCANNDCNMFYARLTSLTSAFEKRDQLRKLGADAPFDLAPELYVC